MIMHCSMAGMKMKVNMVRLHLSGWHVKYSFWVHFEERESNDGERESEKEEYYQ